MEAAAVLASLKIAYHLVISGIQLDQVPTNVRHCLELVRTCHYDLEDLIKLRNENLPLLETKPAILRRTNAIIESAHMGLLEVCKVVEKLRPAAHDGRTPFLSRLEWMLVDSRQFVSQEPTVSRQHSAVIAELNFLRQLVLMGPLVGEASGMTKKDDHQGGKKQSTTTWDNIAILDEMLGGGDRSLKPLGPDALSNLAPVSDDSASIRYGQDPGAMESPPPPYSNSRPVSAMSRTSLSHQMSSIVQPQDAASSPRNSRKFRSIGNKTFDEEGVSLLFGGFEKSSFIQAPAALPGLAPASPPFPTASRFASQDPQTVRQSWAQPVAQLPAQMSLSFNTAASAQDQLPTSDQLPTQLYLNHHTTAVSGPTPTIPSQVLQHRHSHQFSLLGQPWGQTVQHVPAVPSNTAFRTGSASLSTIPQELIYRHDQFGSTPQYPPDFGSAEVPIVQPAVTLASAPMANSAAPLAGPSYTNSMLPTTQIQGWRQSAESSQAHSLAKLPGHTSTTMAPGFSAAVAASPPWYFHGVSHMHNPEPGGLSGIGTIASPAISMTAPVAGSPNLSQSGPITTASTDSTAMTEENGVCTVRTSMKSNAVITPGDCDSLNAPNGPIPYFGTQVVNAQPQELSGVAFESNPAELA